MNTGTSQPFCFGPYCWCLWLSLIVFDVNAIREKSESGPPMWILHDVFSEFKIRICKTGCHVSGDAFSDASSEEVDMQTTFPLLQRARRKMRHLSWYEMASLTLLSGESNQLRHAVNCESYDQSTCASWDSGFLTVVNVYKTKRGITAADVSVEFVEKVSEWIKIVAGHSFIKQQTLH